MRLVTGAVDSAMAPAGNSQPNSPAASRTCCAACSMRVLSQRKGRQAWSIHALFLAEAIDWPAVFIQGLT
jgi:hypothetical protein